MHPGSLHRCSPIDASSLDLPRHETDSSLSMLLDLVDLSPDPHEAHITPRYLSQFTQLRREIYGFLPLRDQDR